MVHDGLEAMRSRLNIELYEPDSSWFGPDIIHVLYWKRRDFYHRVIERISDLDAGQKPEFEQSLHGCGWQQRPQFACKKLLGRVYYHPQPSGLLADGSRVSMY